MGDNAETRPVGRPTDYDPAMCDRVIAMGKEGKSRAEIASGLDCSRTSLAAWERAHPEFMNALSRAKDESLAWWEAKARTGLDQGSQFNAGLWGKAVSGRFPDEPYRERVQVTGRNDGPVEYANLTEAEIDARLAAIAAGAQPATPSSEA